MCVWDVTIEEDEWSMECRWIRVIEGLRQDFGES